MSADNNTGLAVTASTGIATYIMHFFDTHAAGIGAIITCLSFSVYLISQVLKWKQYYEQRHNEESPKG